MQNQDDIYTRVTNQIIAAIEAGAKSWRMPWHITEAECFQPMNAVSKNAYRGVNIPILWIAAINKDYKSGLWATYEQWKQLGAHVRKGEKSTLVLLWKPTITKTKNPKALKDEEKTARGLIARGYSVFNAAQTDGYQALNTPKLYPHVRIKAADRMLLGAGAEVRHGGASAYYNAEGDFIAIPRIEMFPDVMRYYSVLAHELTHWTAAPSRLNRKLAERFGTADYAAEELVAELGAAFLCAKLGLAVEPREDHAAYIENWLTILKSDKKAIFTAASKAQQAADWIFQQTDRNTENAAA